MEEGQTHLWEELHRLYPLFQAIGLHLIPLSFLAEEEEFKNKLLQAIQKLNETQRVAFLMHRIDGKKYAQIADELGISIKAVEKRIQIALQELRKEFDYFR